MLETNLSLRHGLSRETSTLDRIICEADAKPRIRQLAGSDSLLFERLCSCEVSGLSRFLRERNSLGFSQTQSKLLLTEGNSREAETGDY